MPKLDITMTAEERDAYLIEQRTVRLATADDEGTPHAVPLWFVWHDGVMWLNSTLGNVTVENMLRSGKATGVVDDGAAYDELRGVTVIARAERVGDQAPEVVERTWSEKYLGGNELPYRRWRNRSWFRLTPVDVASWDFRKIPEARTRAKREGGRTVAATVRLRGIRVEGRHGVREDEREQAQPFELDLDLGVEAARDDLHATADYEQVVSVVRGLVATESFELIETLASRVARVVADLPAVRWCRAAVHKPNAAERLGVRCVTAEATAGDEG